MRNLLRIKVFELVFYDKKAEQNLAKLPNKLKARMLRLFDLLQMHGNEIDREHSKAFKDGLYELRLNPQKA